MANITATTASAFIPEIWANLALEQLRANVVLAKLVAKDTDLAAFNVGDVLHILYPGTFSANDKAANGAVSRSPPRGAWIETGNCKQSSRKSESLPPRGAWMETTLLYLPARIPSENATPKAVMKTGTCSPLQLGNLCRRFVYRFDRFGGLPPRMHSHTATRMLVA